MKKVLIMSTILVMAISAYAESEVMKIEMTDGTSQSIDIDKIKEITFDVRSDDGEDLQVHEAVDLGLSVKWATCNVGATTPTDFGGYYAWGETEEKEIYTGQTYSDPNPDGDAMDISGTEYDVAHVKWGGEWRMPTHDEFVELITTCTWEWTTIGDTSGYKVTGINGNYIFLPASGYKQHGMVHGDATQVGSPNSCGWYKTSTDKGRGPCYIIFGPTYISDNGDGAAVDGNSVRAVMN